MCKFLKFILYLLLTCRGMLSADFQIPTNELKAISDGLNIEGGLPALALKEGQIWANLCVILDRPFNDGLDFDEISSTNTYPLKESSIVSYNEAQVHYAFLTAIYYYITHAQRITQKHDQERVKVTVQLHRNSSGANHLKILEELMSIAFKATPYMKLENLNTEKNTQFVYDYPDCQVVVDYRFGYSSEDLNNYQGQDIVLSLGLASGFRSDWPSGTLLMSEKFIPIDLKDMVIQKNSCYAVANHLINALPDMLQQQNPTLLQAVSTHFRSLNPHKGAHTAKNLSLCDFHSATLLQACEIFNPKRLPKFLTVKQ